MGKKRRERKARRQAADARFDETIRKVVEVRELKPAKAAGNVLLKGGPMDGWLVGDEAPALHPGWYETWPPDVRGSWKPGRYDPPKLADGVLTAEWREL